LTNIKLKYNLNQIDKAVEFILDNLSSKIILFYGEMGSGKTTIIKRLLYKLDCHDVISSPTFSIVNEYKLTDSNAYHFDFYRINNEIEALDFGFEEYMSKNNWCFIEWPEKIYNLIPKKAQSIKITILDSITREIHIND
jgi:tRNA threonylcarbamoyladenosine biosynthesis protein TsaE